MRNRLSSITQTVSTSIWVAKIFFSTAPFLTTIYLLGEIFRPISNIISAFILGLVIDRVIFLINSGSVNAGDFLPTLALLLGFDIFFSIFTTSSNFARRILNRKLEYSIRRMMQEHMRVLGVAKLENPEVSNKAQRFTEQIPSIQDHMAMNLSLIASVAGIIGSLAFVVANIPQIIPLYLAVIGIGALIDQDGIRKLWLLDRDNTEQRRSFWWTASRLSEPNELKELLLTGGYSLLRKKYDQFANFMIDQTTKIRKNWLWKIYFASILQTVAYGVGFWLLLTKALVGQITVGNLTFQFRMLTTFSGNMESLFNGFINLRESTIKLIDAKELLELFSPEVDGTIELERNYEATEISFKNASFRYPNAKHDALVDIDLVIKPGERIAIVGENGAGKTTLVKLITRLYRVSAGQLLINDIDINELKINTWYKKLGVLFQDYNVYSHLTLGENVSIGDVSKKHNVEKINKALKKANAKEFTDLYENGLDQILNERFKGGIRPSTGQWQKIAIARFFYRDAPVLILDEPTASIDAVAEAEIFNNIYKFIKNKSVIIISHRFSTVRNADRIIVLDKGRIIEQGSHEELLKMGGKYAKAFNLQARGYK